MLHLSDETLNQVPASILGSTIGTLLPSIASRRDGCLALQTFKEGDELVAVVPAVADECVEFERGREIESGEDVVSLPGRQDEAHRATIAVGDHIYLGREPAS